MAAPDAVDTVPLVERLGLAYWRRLSLVSAISAAEDAVHVLNPGEQAELRRIERGAVLRAAAAGAISATVAASADVASVGVLATLSASTPWLQAWPPWLLAGAVAALAAAAEILFIYRDALRSVHRLSVAAGLDPTTQPPVAAALVRAALEIPNPVRGSLGVDPYREVSRPRLLLASVAYKAKVGLTNFLVKAILRRVLGRAVVRVWLAFVAVPVSAAWNALVAFRVVREARVRAMGPSFVQETAGTLLGQAPLSPAAQCASLRAVASAIVRTHDLHPNLLRLLDAVLEQTASSRAADLDDTAAFLRSLRDLAPDERLVVLGVLDVAAVVDGRLTRAERRLLREARIACGLPADLARARRLLRTFVTGRAASSL
jgi:hypothetical protein